MDIGQPGDPSTPPSDSKFMQIGIAPTVDADIDEVTLKLIQNHQPEEPVIFHNELPKEDWRRLEELALLEVRQEWWISANQRIVNIRVVPKEVKRIEQTITAILNKRG